MNDGYVRWNYLMYFLLILHREWISTMIIEFLIRDHLDVIIFRLKYNPSVVVSHCVIELEMKRTMKKENMKNIFVAEKTIGQEKKLFHRRMIRKSSFDLRCRILKSMLEDRWKQKRLLQRKTSLNEKTRKHTDDWSIGIKFVVLNKLDEAKQENRTRKAFSMGLLYVISVEKKKKYRRSVIISFYLHQISPAYRKCYIHTSATKMHKRNHRQLYFGMWLKVKFTSKC